MIFPKLRRRLSGNAGRLSGRGNSGSSALPGTPLDGGVVSCQVHDEQGRLLPDAEITVVDRFNQQIAQGNTDAYGYYLAAVQPGIHKVSVHAGGFQRATTRVDVRTNRHTAIGSIHLAPDDSLNLPEPGVWRVDPAHTEVRFIAQHVGMAKIHGRFSSFDGHIRVGSQFEQSRIEVEIDAASIDTGFDYRDQHLRSADFLDVENYPKLYFSTQRLTRLRGNRWVVNGSLTLRGTTSPVQLETSYLGIRSFHGMRAACLATTELRREDYAINWQQTLAKGIAVVGPSIRVELDIQVVREE